MCHEKLARQALAESTGKWPRCPKTRLNDYISDLAWSRLGVEATELSEIAVDREVFRVLLVLLPHDSPYRKNGHGIK